LLNFGRNYKSKNIRKLGAFEQLKTHNGMWTRYHFDKNENIKGEGFGKDTPH